MLISSIWRNTYITLMLLLLQIMSTVTVMVTTIVVTTVVAAVNTLDMTSTRNETVVDGSIVGMHVPIMGRMN